MPIPPPRPPSPRQPDPFTTLLPALHRRARRLTRSPDHAADLAQEAALRVWAALRGGARIEALQPYAMTALRNLALSHHRAAQVMEPLAEHHASTRAEVPARLACAELRAAIATLPPAQAALMTLVAEGETSPARLAALTGVPVGTAMSRLARARAALRARLAGGAPGGTVAALLDDI